MLMIVVAFISHSYCSSMFHQLCQSRCVTIYRCIHFISRVTFCFVEYTHWSFFFVALKRKKFLTHLCCTSWAVAHVDRCRTPGTPTCSSHQSDQSHHLAAHPFHNILPFSCTTCHYWIDNALRTSIGLHQRSYPPVLSLARLVNISIITEMNASFYCCLASTTSSVLYFVPFCLIQCCAIYWIRLRLLILILFRW
jgi:hypothetical protein